MLCNTLLVSTMSPHKSALSKRMSPPERKDLSIGKVG